MAFDPVLGYDTGVVSDGAGWSARDVQDLLWNANDAALGWYATVNNTPIRTVGNSTGFGQIVQAGSPVLSGGLGNNGLLLLLLVGVLIYVANK